VPDTTSLAQLSSVTPMLANRAAETAFSRVRPRRSMYAAAPSARAGWMVMAGGIWRTSLGLTNGQAVALAFNDRLHRENGASGTGQGACACESQASGDGDRDSKVHVTPRFSELQAAFSTNCIA